VDPPDGSAPFLEENALLATGRRVLLLADDSPATQKVVSLTFADEGFDVVAVGDGAEAIRRIEAGLMPDVVLADVHMPGMTGYELCERIKGDSRLGHIPVMLLVGMFEPFDLSEARRVGAEINLTKPFQSIRDLMSKVKSLLGGSNPPPESEARTPVQLSSQSDAAFGDVVMDDAMIEERPVENFEFADTLREPQVVDEQTPQPASAPAEPVADPAFVPQTAAVASNNASASSDDSLLDLDLEPPAAVSEADEFILDLSESDSSPPRKPASVVSWEDRQSSSARGSKSAFVEPAVSVATEAPPVEAVPAPSVAAPEAENVGVARVGVDESVSADALSPAMIDAIARRVVEMMSDKVVREVAWEVVPDLAELLIKQKMEEDPRLK
jgi:CheY-like chemotaxis protein